MPLHAIPPEREKRKLSQRMSPNQLTVSLMSWACCSQHLETFLIRSGMIRHHRLRPDSGLLSAQTLPSFRFLIKHPHQPSSHKHMIIFRVTITKIRRLFLRFFATYPITLAIQTTKALFPLANVSTLLHNVSTFYTVFSLTEKNTRARRREEEFNTRGHSGFLQLRDFDNVTWARSHSL